MQGNKEILEKWMEDPSFINWVFQSNKADRTKWEDWLTKNPAYRELAEDSKELLLKIVGEMDNSEHKSLRALEKLHHQLRSKKLPIEPPMPVPNARRSLKYSPWWIAAAVAVLIFSSLMVYAFLDRKSMVIISTGFAEKQEFTLPDRSVIILNANSTVRYDSQKPREIWLSGEGFFKVARKPKTGSTFNVYTHDLEIEVLGTSFNVNSRRDQTKVFLEEGKINLSLKDTLNSQLILSPGELVTFSSKQGSKYERIQVESKSKPSWRDGVIELKMTALNEVLDQMEDLFGIKVEIGNDQLRTRKINVAIPIEELNIALSQIEFALNLSIRKLDEHTYIIE